MSEDCNGENYFLLPEEDGSTVIVNSEISQEPSARRGAIFSRVMLRAVPEVHSTSSGMEELEKYMTVFPEESKLKVALFEEMLRMMPRWMENRESWFRDLCAMAAKGIAFQDKPRTPQETTALEWLFLVVTEPKMREIHESSFKALLELAQEKHPLPKRVFLLEYAECRTNDVSYAFCSAEPGQVMSLVYNFGEAGYGRCCSRSLASALERMKDSSFTLWGQTFPRYRCVLMLEFVSHPGIEPVEELKERSSCSGSLQNPGLHRIVDVTQARVLALLLFESEPAALPTRRVETFIIGGIWLVMAVHAVFTLYRLRERVN